MFIPAALKAKEPPHIVAIDDESLEALGRWPWPRDYHGELIRLIGEGEPLVIGYDIIFAEESAEEGEDDYMIDVHQGKLSGVNVSIIIGDECYIPPTWCKRTACAYTCMYEVTDIGCK